MKRHLITLLILSTASCSYIASKFDSVYLVCLANTCNESTKTPPGFVVTPQELTEFTILTKTGWNIYADNEYYYLSSIIQKFTSKTGDNSHLAKENGIRINGTNRNDIEIINKYLRKTNRTVITPNQLRAILEKK